MLISITYRLTDRLGISFGLRDVCVLIYWALS
jgi:hypothetical protein